MSTATINTHVPATRFSLYFLSSFSNVLFFFFFVQHLSITATPRFFFFFFSASFSCRQFLSPRRWTLSQLIDHFIPPQCVSPSYPSPTPAPPLRLLHHHRCDFPLFSFLYSSLSISFTSPSFLPLLSSAPSPPSAVFSSRCVLPFLCPSPSLLSLLLHLSSNLSRPSLCSPGAGFPPLLFLLSGLIWFSALLFPSLPCPSLYPVLRITLLLAPSLTLCLSLPFSLIFPPASSFVCPCSPSPHLPLLYPLHVTRLAICIATGSRLPLIMLPILPVHSPLPVFSFIKRFLFFQLFFIIPLVLFLLSRVSISACSILFYQAFIPPLSFFFFLPSFSKFLSLSVSFSFSFFCFIPAVSFSTFTGFYLPLFLFFAASLFHQAFIPVCSSPS